MFDLILYAGFSGITVFIGGVMAYYFNHHSPNKPVKYRITHTASAFGAGIILSAVALVLVPESMTNLTLLEIILSFMAGAILFYFIDKQLSKRGNQTATLLAMLMDFVPESIALGAIFGAANSSATLLAVFIGLQNLPEAFNAFRDLVISGFGVKKTLIIFFFLSFLGIISALIGHFLLTDNAVLTAYLMSFASGGILYLLIQDIIPESKTKDGFPTAIGATLGFLLGMIGEKIL